jgi:hypothetical protein
MAGSMVHILDTSKCWGFTNSLGQKILVLQAQPESRFILFNYRHDLATGRDRRLCSDLLVVAHGHARKRGWGLLDEAAIVRGLREKLLERRGLGLTDDKKTTIEVTDYATGTRAAFTVTWGL